MVFHWRLSDSKSPHVSRTLLSTMANLNNAAVWMVPARLPIFKSSCLLVLYSRNTTIRFAFHRVVSLRSRRDLRGMVFSFSLFLSEASCAAQLSEWILASSVI